MNKPFKLAQALPIMADVTVSISDLKKNPAAVIAEAKVRQVAITNRNRPVAYIVSPEVWDHISDVFADRKIERMAEEALENPGEWVEVSIDDL
jgi:antitoxin StbD